jgi:hypothetical protein
MSVYLNGLLTGNDDKNLEWNGKWEFIKDHKKIRLPFTYKVLIKYFIINNITIL